MVCDLMICLVAVQSQTDSIVPNHICSGTLYEECRFLRVCPTEGNTCSGLLFLPHALEVKEHSGLSRSSSV